MKKIFFLLLIINATCFAQILTDIDPPLKTTLLNTSPSNQIAGINVIDGSPSAYVSIDANHDGQIEQSEADVIEYLDIGGFINNINGLCHFVNLKVLILTPYSPIALDLRCFTHLKQYLGQWGINNNVVTALNVSGMTSLEYCYSKLAPSVTSVGLDGLVNLTNLLLRGNSQINSLSFSDKPNLIFAEIKSNMISELDFSQNHNFKVLYCSSNPNLTSINIKNGSQQELINTTTSNYYDCWATGCPNLTNICADDNEVAAVQSMLNSCAPGNTITVDSSCAMANEDFVVGSNIINLYPNPTSSTVNINSNGKFTIKSVTLYDMMGHAIYQPMLNNSIGTITSFDMTAIAKGVYIVKIDTDKGSASEKIVKE
jgi:Secretion system C-terminal sorting domain